MITNTFKEKVGDMLGTGELIVILCVVLILFGGKRLPELARSIGLGIREFKKACYGIDEEVTPTTQKKNLEPVILDVEPDDHNSKN